MQGEKLVLDTNIWVSYFQKLVTAVYDYNLQLFTTQLLIEEITDVLNRPKINKFQVLKNV